MTVQTLPEMTLSPAAVHRGACPVMAFQAMISGKYKIRILWDLKEGPRRYSEIRAGLLRGAAGLRKSRRACSAANSRRLSPPD